MPVGIKNMKTCLAWEERAYKKSCEDVQGDRNKCRKCGVYFSCKDRGHLPEPYPEDPCDFKDIGVTLK